MAPTHLRHWSDMKTCIDHYRDLYKNANQHWSKYLREAGRNI